MNQQYRNSDSQNRDTQQSESKGNRQNEPIKRNQDIANVIVAKIDKFTTGLSEYKTRELVEDTEKLGKHLADIGLKTTQIRKFLDAVNQLKVKFRENDILTEETKSELELLRPKLAYAAARQQKNKNELGPVEPLRRVLEAAIKHVYGMEDFKRLSQLIESIIAYHKAAGGKDQ